MGGGHDSIVWPEIISWGVEKPGRDIWSCGSEGKLLEDSRNGLLPMSGSGHPVVGGILLTQTKNDNRDLLHFNLLGCPIFLLYTKLQEGKKIAKWNCYPWLEFFLWQAFLLGSKCQKLDCWVYPSPISRCVLWYASYSLCNWGIWSSHCFYLQWF